jgi:hypothetical protein
MNRKSTLVAIAIATAAFSAAAEGPIEQPSTFVSTASRAQVQNDVLNAKGVKPWSIRYNPLADFRSMKTRAQVTAEYVDAREVVAAFTGEDSGSGYVNGRPAAAGEPRLASR